MKILEVNIPKDREELKSLDGKVVPELLVTFREAVVLAGVRCIKGDKFEFLYQNNDSTNRQPTDQINYVLVHSSRVQYFQRGIEIGATHSVHCNPGETDYDERLRVLQANPGMWVEPVSREEVV